MKTLYILFIGLLVSGGVMAQSCLPEGIGFGSQVQIDSFQINYPNCTEIEGDLRIAGMDITNLNGLSVLTSIGGDLIIGYDNYAVNPNLTNLIGLEGLTTIGGNLGIWGNIGLTSLTGLDNLNSIGGGLSIGGESTPPNYALTSLTGLENLTSIGGGLGICCSPALTSLTGLDNLDAGSITDLYIYANSSLSNCEVQSVCDYLASPNGIVSIHHNASGCNTAPEVADNCGISLQCLPYGNYYFSSQEDIDDFQTDFPNCTELEGGVYIWGGWGSDITNLDGLNSITSISWHLSFYSNDSLTSLAGLDHLDSIGGLSIRNNDALINLSGLEDISFIGGISIHSNDALSSLSGLGNLTHIGSLSVRDNDTLSSLTGLESVTSIGWDLEIEGNNSLISLTGLDNVTSIGRDLEIHVNNSLISLTGLDNVTSIGGHLWIQQNDSLNSLMGLYNVTSVGQSIAIYGNDTLTNLTGLDNIEADSIEDLVIKNNPYLSHCSVLSICNYLSNPSGIVDIENNNTGCDNPAQVEDSCYWVSVDDPYIDFTKRLLIYPNPSSTQITIELPTTPQKNTSLTIYNLNGQQLITQQLTEPQTVVDISGLPRGVYFVKVMDDENVVMGKVIKQ